MWSGNLAWVPLHRGCIPGHHICCDIHQLSVCSTMSVAFFLSVFLIPVIEGEQLRWAITVVIVSHDSSMPECYCMAQSYIDK